MSQRIDLNEAKAIIDWVNLSEDIRELSLKCGDLELFISRNEYSSRSGSVNATAEKVTPTSAAPAIPASEPASIAESEILPVNAATTSTDDLGLASDEVVIRAPMVGTFYAAPKPGAPAFVKEGDEVTKDSVLCIVEVMKLMNNVEAGVNGVVQKILVSNEEPVEYNQPLMIIKLDS